MEKTPAQVIRTQDIGDLALLTASTLGFWPAESLTLVSLRGPRRRSGLIARVALDDLAASPQAVDVLIHHLQQNEATTVVLIVWSDTLTPQAAAALAEPTALAMLAADLPAEVATIANGAIHQHGCDQGCCASARPLPTDSPTAAALVSAGMAVLPDRQALIDSLNGTPVSDEALANATPADVFAWLQAAAAFVAHPGATLTDQQAADLLLSAQPTKTRDRLISSTIAGQVPLELLLHLAQRAHPEHQGIYGALAMSAWLSGRLILAEAAIDHLPAENTLGRLLAQTIALGIPPIDQDEFLSNNPDTLTSP